MRSDISIVCIAKNEKDKLKMHLPIWKTICKEVIVVDTGSKDNSQDVIIENGCTLIENEWIGYGANKNIGNNAAQNNWILSLDADELPNKSLIHTIDNIVLSEHMTYKLNIHTAINDVFINHCGWHPLYLPRLFNKKYVKWNENIVHEKLESIDKNKHLVFQKLDGKIKHFSFDNFLDFEMKMNHYAKLRGENWHLQRKKMSLTRQIFGPVGRFLTSYIYKLGFLDGLLGFKICLGEAKMIQKEIFHYKNFHKS